MDAKAVLIRENDRVRRQLQLICSDLKDEQITFGHEAVDERGIGNVVQHLYGGMVRRVDLILGNTPPPSNTEPPTTAESLMAYIEEAHRQLAERMAKITDEHLEANVKNLANREMTGITSITEGYAHAYRHIGNILDLRHLGGFETHALG
jgi:hypothetical protein